MQDSLVIGSENEFENKVCQRQSKQRIFHRLRTEIQRTSSECFTFISAAISSAQRLKMHARMELVSISAVVDFLRRAHDEEQNAGSGK